MEHAETRFMTNVACVFVCLSVWPENRGRVVSTPVLYTRDVSRSGFLPVTGSPNRSLLCFHIEGRINKILRLKIVIVEECNL
jgi:hypothetical protein